MSRGSWCGKAIEALLKGATAGQPDAATRDFGAYLRATSSAYKWLIGPSGDRPDNRSDAQLAARADVGRLFDNGFGRKQITKSGATVWQIATYPEFFRNYVREREGFGIYNASGYVSKDVFNAYVKELSHAMEKAHGSCIVHLALAVDTGIKNQDSKIIVENKGVLVQGGVGIKPPIEGAVTSPIIEYNKYMPSSIDGLPTVAEKGTKLYEQATHVLDGSWAFEDSMGPVDVVLSDIWAPDGKSLVLALRTCLDTNTVGETLCPSVMSVVAAGSPLSEGSLSRGCDLLVNDSLVQESPTNPPNLIDNTGRYIPVERFAPKASRFIERCTNSSAEFIARSIGYSYKRSQISQRESYNEDFRYKRGDGALLGESGVQVTEIHEVANPDTILSSKTQVGFDSGTDALAAWFEAPPSVDPTSTAPEPQNDSEGPLPIEDRDPKEKSMHKTIPMSSFRYHGHSPTTLHNTVKEHATQDGDHLMLGSDGLEHPDSKEHAQKAIGAGAAIICVAPQEGASEDIFEFATGQKISRQAHNPLLRFYAIRKNKIGGWDEAHFFSLPTANKKTEATAIGCIELHTPEATNQQMKHLQEWLLEMRLPKMNLAAGDEPNLFNAAAAYNTDAYWQMPVADDSGNIHYNDFKVTFMAQAASNNIDKNKENDMDWYFLTGVALWDPSEGYFTDSTNSRGWYVDHYQFKLWPMGFEPTNPPSPNPILQSIQVQPQTTSSQISCSNSVTQSIDGSVGFFGDDAGTANIGGSISWSHGTTFLVQDIEIEASAEVNSAVWNYTVNAGGSGPKLVKTEDGSLPSPVHHAKSSFEPAHTVVWKGATQDVRNKVPLATCLEVMAELDVEYVWSRVVGGQQTDSTHTLSDCLKSWVPNHGVNLIVKIPFPPSVDV